MHNHKLSFLVSLMPKYQETHHLKVKMTKLKEKM